MPSPPSSTSSSFLFSSSLPPPSAVILIRRERPAKELQLVVTGHLPPVEVEIRPQMRDFKYEQIYLENRTFVLDFEFYVKSNVLSTLRLGLQQRQHYIKG